MCDGLVCLQVMQNLWANTNTGFRGQRDEARDGGCWLGSTDPDLWLRLRWSDLKPIHSSREKNKKRSVIGYIVTSAFFFLFFFRCVNFAASPYWGWSPTGPHIPYIYLSRYQSPALKVFYQTLREPWSWLRVHHTRW